MMKSNPSHLAKKSCETVLGLDESIRFVGKVVDRKLLAFVRQKNSTPLLNDELENMAHHQASVKVMMEEMFDDSLGMTNWMITSKEKVKLVSVFLDEGMIILSMEPDGNHEEVVKQIQNLNVNL